MLVFITYIVSNPIRKIIMTSNQEDIMNEIYHKVNSSEKLKIRFYKQLDKIGIQDKHKYKSACERWEYALYRAEGGKSKEKY